MARLLEQLKPLSMLLGQAADPHALLENLREAVRAGRDGGMITAQLSAGVTDGLLANGALTHAEILDSRGRLTDEAGIRLAQVAVLLEVTEDGGWELVLTVPGFLRPALDALIAEHGDRSRPRETVSALREVAGLAGRRLVIAAPYLHEDFVQTLVPHVERIFAGRGEVVVITRALALTTPARSSANVGAVALLREAAGHNGGTLTVRSWEESGLGVHFKIVLAESSTGALSAYLGSANLTPGGTAAHAEAGVLLRGSGVEGLDSWLAAVGVELAQRRLPHG